MRGLVNFRKEPYSAELREIPVPVIDEDDLLVSVKAVDLDPILTRVAPLEE